MHDRNVTDETTMPRDEILRKTKAVSQVLEALRNEHRQTLSSLQSATDDNNCTSSDGKISMVAKSLEQLELGVSEAQVRTVTRYKLLYDSLVFFDLIIAFLKLSCRGYVSVVTTKGKPAAAIGFCSVRKLYMHWRWNTTGNHTALEKAFKGGRIPVIMGHCYGTLLPTHCNEDRLG